MGKGPLDDGRAKTEHQECAEVPDEPESTHPLMPALDW
jgi:hypothetical protein